MPSTVLDALFANDRLLVAWLDRDFRFVRVSRAYADAGRRPPEAYVGVGHFELYPHAENEALFRRVIETGERIVIRAKPFVHPDQPERPMTWWDWTLDPVCGASGEVVGLLFVLIDVTDQVVAEHLARERADLLRALQHGLRNHLQIILSLLNDVRRRIPGPIVEALVGRVRAVAVVHEDGVRARPGFVDLAAQARRIVEDVRDRETRKGVEVMVAGQGDAPLEMAAPFGLLVHELVRNALVHAYEGDESGRIDVALEVGNDGEATLVVRDDGRGLPEALPVRGDAVWSGLSLVHGLAAQLGGKAERRAGSVRGTEWTVRFRVARAPSR